MAPDENAQARHWFGDVAQVTVMHWHYEAFDLPPGATRLASSAACPNQAFAIGPHLAMQFHVELEDAKLDRWSSEREPGWIASIGVHASVQDAQTMREEGRRRMAGHQRLADRIYGRWLAGTSRAVFAS